MRRSAARLLVLAASLALAGSISCRSAAAPSATPAAGTAAAVGDRAGAGAAIPLSPAVKRAQLPNGLTYYVRKNARPEKRAIIWLVVDAGSVLEDDDQRGLAHFVEHMAFNGTRHFAKQEIVNSLQRMGMRFGPDINASTDFDETVYQLEVPTDDPKAIDRALDILHDWATDISFEPDAVAKERGVVLEERRLGRGAEGRLLDELIPAALPGSRYGARIPIGTEDVLKHATPDGLRRFYRDWYRPDRMAVVAVGDFDAAAVEKRIAARFADLAGSGKVRPRPDTAVPPHAGTVAVILKDPELPVTAVAVVAKRPRRKQTTEDDYRQSLTDRLFVAMLNQRLDELRRAADAPFLGAGVGRQTVVRPIDAWFQFAVVKGDKVSASLEALTGEVARVARFGFTDGEIDRARKDMLRGYQQQAHEEDKTQSRQLAAEIQRNFLLGESMPGIAAELALVERLLPAITSEEIRRVAGEVASEESRVIVAAGHSSTALPDKTQLLAAAAAGRARATTAYVDQAGGAELLDHAPAPGKIARQQTISEIGATELHLSNGVTVVLKPTDFQNDSILISGRVPGGTSRARDADYPSARAADEVAAAGGFGKYSAVQLGKRLAGSGVSAGVSFGELDASVGGEAPRDQLELLLQLIHLEMTEPRRDQAAFASWKAQEVEALRNQLASPEAAFAHRFASEAGRGHLRRKLPTAADYDKVDLDRALSFYRERFASSRGATFVIVGAFDVEKVKPLVLTYLGGLPGKGPTQRWRDVGARQLRGPHHFEVKQGVEPKARVRLEFYGPARWSREATHDLDSLAQVLRIRLREELREEMGGVYGVAVDGDLRRDPRPELELSIEFGCAPENVASLVARARAVLDAVRREGPPAAAIEKVVAAQRRGRETDLKDNEFWVGVLTSYYRFGWDPRLILDYDRLIARVNPKTLQETARRALGGNELLGTLLPR
ncbi:MAG TPA: insulinase family protein [Kofleriaceae bacterium]|nr:insulinase family protein [Kofleriaceae bacterium]